jgi:N utilization substance protein B
MGLRRRSREIALQILFQSEFGTDETPDSGVALYLENFEGDTEIKEYAAELVNGVWQNHDEIDRIIQAHSQNWKVSRMALVDKNILRIAVYELKYLSEKVPRNVVFDEAIEIGKRFGSQETSSFVNGVLDNIVKSLPQ